MLHEDVLGFMWVALCANWQGLTLKQTTKTLTGWLSMGQQCICWPSSPTTSSFHSIYFEMIFDCYKDSITQTKSDKLWI
jgi:hypothetical protein